MIKKGAKKNQIIQTITVGQKVDLLSKIWVISKLNRQDIR